MNGRKWLQEQAEEQIRIVFQADTTCSVWPAGRSAAHTEHEQNNIQKTGQQ
jgi:hypothetical protein